MHEMEQLRSGPNFTTDPIVLGLWDPVAVYDLLNISYRVVILAQKKENVNHC